MAQQTAAAKKAAAARKGKTTAERAAEAGAAAPADHKKPASDEKAQATGAPIEVEVFGHTYVIDQDALDDAEVLEDIGRLDDGDTGRVPSIMRRMLGEKQHAKVKERLRNPDTGRVPLHGDRGYLQFFRELFEAANPS